MRGASHPSFFLFFTKRVDIFFPYAIIVVKALFSINRYIKKENNMRILIGADLVPTKDTEKYFIAADTEALYGKIAPLAGEMDRVMVNLECALTSYDGAIKKFGPNIKADPACVNGIKALGVTDVMLSNNHTFDFGIKGLRDTMETLESAGIPYGGVGENDTDSRKPYFIECCGKKIGVINVCEHEYSYALPNRIGANPFDPFLTMQDIREIKKASDYVIVIYHGGKEYCHYPSPRLRNLCREMVYCGADVVLTQHSHCIGCYEKFEGGHIVYGQGNFNFVFNDYSHPDCWNQALLVELDIENGVDIKFHPIVATTTGCDLAEGEEKEKIVAEFEARNASLLDGTWIDGWHEFCLGMSNIYKKAAEGMGSGERENQLFAHYLDCEAHTDVWRELYPTWNATNEL